jgi:hypothetical protein
MKAEFFVYYQLPVVIGTISKEILGTRLIEYSNRLVSYHNPALIPKKSDITYHPKNGQWIYITIITSPNVNHPYIVFADTSSNIIGMLIPYGLEQKQAPMQEIPSIIPMCNPMEKYALYLALVKSIDMRKSAILESDQYSLLKCENISNCSKKLNEIKKMKTSKAQKIEMIRECQSVYMEKAVVFLRKYFILLANQDYTEAREFLKGDKGKYFGKQRLNTFFKNSKAIIGHLHIFIPLYQYLAVISQQIG